jgi:hypothetical protein
MSKQTENSSADKKSRSRKPSTTSGRLAEGAKDKPVIDIHIPTETSTPPLPTPSKDSVKSVKEYKKYSYTVYEFANYLVDLTECDVSDKSLEYQLDLVCHAHPKKFVSQNFNSTFYSCKPVGGSFITKKQRKNN